MVTEAQKRASAKYQREKMKQVSVKFSPNESDIYEWVKSQKGSASGYLKRLAEEDMNKKRYN